MVDIQEYLARIIPSNGNVQLVDSDGGSLPANSLAPTLRVVCFGGGAAELVAFGGFIQYLQRTLTSEDTGDGDVSSITKDLQKMRVCSKETNVNLLLLDVARWEDVVQRLHLGLVNPPSISKYANASTREANVALISKDSLSSQFRAEDVFEMGLKQLVDQFGQTQMLLTLLFTLNELYTASIGKTTTFLLNLTAAVKPGTLLLVVDSPGSYSETNVGTESKKYPMQWLLNHTLIESQKAKSTSNEKGSPSWVKEVSEDSKWFRMPESLRYPIPLENMRYQIHLYRRV